MENQNEETAASKQTNLSSRTLNQVGATRRQHVTRVPQHEVHSFRGRFNQRYQPRPNSRSGGIENESSTLRQSNAGAKKDVVKHKRVEPVGFTPIIPSNGNNNRHQSTSSGGAIKKQFGPRYDGRNRYQKDNFPVTRNHYTDRNDGGKRRCVSFKYLDDILKLDEEDFVLNISTNMRRLNELVENIDLTNDTYVLIIRLLKKIFDSRFPNSQQVLLQTILKERFVDNLQKYVCSLPMHNENQKLQNKYFWQNTDAFLTTLIEVTGKALELLPSYTSNVLPKVVLALQVFIPLFEEHQKQRVSDEIKKALHEVTEVLEATKLRFEKSAVVITTRTKTGKKLIFERDEPPDDFRTISVYPDASEILSECSFLRPNIIHGPYRDVNHYLDIQFRLLREDFVNPLRSGVRSIQSKENMRYENVRVYKRIRFLRHEIINEYYCIRLRFNFNRKSLDFNYENSKKFMFGTLLCFTRDNFDTLKFARVVKRDPVDLTKGELVVGFDTPQSDLSFGDDYLMIECSVYFEPYFNVLTALKFIDEDDFAMKEYIVDVQTVDVLPKYLNPFSTYEIDKRVFDLMSINENVYGFNGSQMKAFKAALTHEFAMIQGPPGTGKTYLGLKIAKTLLDNHEVWWESTPMLVICFTNHALDQFLAGLLDTTENIVRIGGQSKNESLEHLNLSVLRRNSSNDVSYKSKKQVQNKLDELGSVTAKIKKIEQYVGVIAFWEFYNSVPGFKETFSREAGPKYFIEWLLEGYQEQYFDSEEFEKNLDINTDENLENGDENNEGSAKFFVHDDQNAKANHGSLAEELFANMQFPPTRSAITLGDLSRRMDELKIAIHEWESSKDARTLGRLVIDEKKRVLLELCAQYKYLKRRLGEVSSAIQNQRIRTDIKARNLTFMHHDDRWALYTFWLNYYKQHLQHQATVLTGEFRGLYKQYEEIQNLEDTHLLRQKLVVGMTTTSAARLRSVLQGLRSPIVIVEEAAEVLEAHIITALTKHCQHLILIGDHKQLKPSSADYKITKDYNLGISLFERMVNNGIQCHTLNVQHRMRPEISKLICPTIYRDLKDHESVFNRPPIAGVDSCIRFIDHKNLEDDCGENPTKKNLYEVELAVALARHLILNGYKPEQVTILAAYLGQMFAMFKERDKHGHIMENLRIAALDNYQGEENDIIILSLVRSNTIQKIGFLAIENRVCVALSRAKHGFYIIGNMGLLCSTSELWREIKDTLKKQNALGPDLTLRCGIHTNVTTLVSKGEDFARISEGGCDQICQAELVCGHFCESLCHVRNREHENYKCLKRCKKTPCDENENHVCLKKCYEECGPCTYIVSKKLTCGHEVSLACGEYKCPMLVLAKLPCDHLVEKPCHADANTFPCPMPCEITVDPCGHSCSRKCHVHDDPDHMEYICMKKCARPRLGCTLGTDSEDHLCPKFCYESCAPCNILMKKRRTKCPHIHKVACSEDVDSIECEKPCTKPLSCGHQCAKKCDEPCEPSSCLVKVKKRLELCGHEISTSCSMEPDRHRCEKKCPLKLPCGHLCTRKCNQVCTPRCEVLVDCQVEAICGHVIMRMKCHDSTSGLAKNDKKLLTNCSEPCNVKLKCGHQCSGTCGECLQGRFHKRCSEKCGVILICNHECRFSCREACRPCDQPCTYRCVHSVCKKKCGNICTPCKEPCQRRCQHQQCSRFCSSICSVSPCTQPCPKSLECGHACIGFCGDPCPPKCLICDREELLETGMLFGYENENSRFVLLADCKHVIESEGMEEWLKMGDDLSAIGVKVCPKCKTQIKTTLRYSDHIKRAIADVNKVKLKATGSTEDNNGIRKSLIERTHILQGRMRSFIWESHLQKLEERLKPTNRRRRQDVNITQLRAIAAKLQVLEQVVGIIKDKKEMEFCLEFQQEICAVLERDVNYITNQEIEDVTSELGRLLRAIQYERMKRSSGFTFCVTTNAETKQLSENIETTLGGVGPYSDDAKLKSWLEELNKKLGSQQVLTDFEKRNIVNAIGMGRGHWFKCPNGHVYVIGECGRPTQLSKCNECDASIGGTGHRLLANNYLASEMDGARYAAYSEMANNMGNFMNII